VARPSPGGPSAAPGGRRRRGARELLALAALTGVLAGPGQARAALPAIDWTQEQAEEAAAARRATHTLLGLSGLGAGVLAAGLGTFFGLQALDTRHRLELTAPGDLPTRTALIGLGEGYRTLANVLFAVAAALGAAGVLVWVF